jgi:divalent metal cation (Fe/Co/Zn/Cd) transporter
LGFKLAYKNVPRLLGEGVDEEVLHGLETLIKKNKYVKDVIGAKAIITGTSKFR